MNNLREVVACVEAANAAHVATSGQLLILLLAAIPFGSSVLLALRAGTVLGFLTAGGLVALGVAAFVSGLLAWDRTSGALTDCIP
ncbi:MAG: hypothetical protein F4X87_04290 [Chloroflexi bacterium]|nr:hypothetical protein [Chloroflexota bacterium]